MPRPTTVIAVQSRRIATGSESGITCGPRRGEVIGIVADIRLGTPIGNEDRVEKRLNRAPNSISISLARATCAANSGGPAVGEAREAAKALKTPARFRR